MTNSRTGLTRAETAAMAESVRSLLADPDTGLSTSARYRWEGCLAGLEAVLGQPTTLPVEDPERFLI